MTQAPSWTSSSRGSHDGLRHFPVEAVRATKQVLIDLTLPDAEATRADARPFQQLDRSDTAQGRIADPWAGRARPRRPHRIPLTRPADWVQPAATPR